MTSITYIKEQRETKFVLKGLSIELVIIIPYMILYLTAFHDLV